jgi:glycosyltransferase involved in cell wall biosynthesis
MLSDLETAGGAAVAASRLAQGLAATGVDVVRIVGTADGKSHSWKTHVLESSDRVSSLSALGPLASPLGSWLTRRALRRSLADLLREVAPDGINVHNIHAAGWPPDLVEVCADHAPTVWTLHDMWSFSGRCAYSYECRKFMTGCDATCPTPDEYPALAPRRIAAAWRSRRRLFDRHPELVAVAPSRWLAATAGAGLWRDHRIEIIPYGLALGSYSPVDRAYARAQLGLKTSGPVMSFVAQSLTERRKGGMILAQALDTVKTRPLTVLTAGHGELRIASDDIDVHSMGYVDDQQLQMLAYNAADLAVHPAPVDNLPNVVMEAIACGTPCVGFAIGGVPDMVRLGTTGWLAEEVTPQALAAAVDGAIAEIRDGRDLRASCRAVAEREYDDRTQAARYVTLFDSLGGRGRRRRTRKRPS